MKMKKQATGTSVGVIGLGIMGSSIAANLQASGFNVTGIEVNPVTRKKMSSRIAKVGAAPRMLIGKTALIVSSLPSVAALMAVSEELANEAVAQGIAKGSVVLAETSTLPMEDKQAARKLLAKAGIKMIDTPLSGTGAQARTRDLTVYASGEAAAIRQMMDVFKGFSRAQFSVGEFGNGMKMKLVANLLVAIHNVSTAEAVLFGKRMGLAPKDIVEVVADGAGGSRMFQVRGPMMVSRGWDDATMKIEVWQKDMSIIDNALRALCLPSPLFAACIPIYHAAMAQGHALHDTAAVYAVLEKFAGES
jgi:3-hydroxyisobutyrate dehydrogenase-like beta-hydroxyacid dehydrogenase